MYFYQKTNGKSFVQLHSLYITKTFTFQIFRRTICLNDIERIQVKRQVLDIIYQYTRHQEKKQMTK